MKHLIYIAFALIATSAYSEEFFFKDFPTTDSTKATVLNIVEKDNEFAKKNSDYLNRHRGEHANFAGKYSLIGWGCGTMCQQIAAINVETGIVHVPGEGKAAVGVCFKKNSRLLIVNPILTSDISAMWKDGMPEWFNTMFYEWTGTEFKLLGTSRKGLTKSCTGW